MKASLTFLFATVLLPPLVADDDVASPETDASSLSNSTRITAQSEAIEANELSSHASSFPEEKSSSPRDGSTANQNTIGNQDEGSAAAAVTTLIQQASNHGLADTATQRMMEDESLTRLPSELKYYFHQYNDNHGPFVWSPEHAEHVQQQHQNHVIIPPYRPFSMDDAPALPSWAFKTTEQVKHRPNRTGGLPASSKNDEESISPKLPAENTTSDGPETKRTTSEGYPTENTAANVPVAEDGPGTNSTTLGGAPTENTTSDVSTEDGPATNSTTSEAASGNASKPVESSASSDKLPVVASEKKTEQEPEQLRQDDEDLVVVDYAGKSGGGLILEKSSGFKGTSNLLTTDNDQYAMVPTAAKNKSLIISLSEEILVKTVVLANYERYSCYVKEFQILGSQTMAKWADLGRYTAKPGKFGRQVFELGEFAKWARYLKFRFLSHYGDEHYLTITQISVYGTTMQQGFHEHWDEQNNENEEDKNKNEEEPEQLKALTNDSIAVSDSASSENNATSIDKLANGDSAITKTGAQSKGFARASSCSSCQARGVGNNGYLLFSWAMPVAKIEPDCQWTALSSASVQVQSSLTSLLRLTTFLADPTAAKTSTFSARQKITGPCCSRMVDCKKEDPSMKSMLVSPSKQLPRLDLQEMPPAVAKILARIENETDNHVNWSEIKSFLSARDSSQKREAVGGTNVLIDKEKDSESPPGREPEPAKGSAVPGGGAKVAEKKTVETKATVPKAGEAKPGVNTVDPSIQHAMPKDQGAYVGAQISEANPVLATLLDRIPSASCLSELDIAQYKAAHSRSTTTGTSSSGPPGGGMEPIFKKLTDEIKSLQASLSVHDRFAKESVACFQRVLLDILILQEQERAEQRMRLEHLENILNGTFLYHAMWLNGTFLYHAMWDLFTAISSILSTVYFYCMTENLLARASEIDWNAILAWVQENMWPSVGFPLSLLCMMLYRYRRNKCIPRKEGI